jgi:dTDP-4-amino-4,6-dideoxy-D-galactose acyltransferase
MNTYKILDWDTEFFGFKVARILPERLGSHRLKDTLLSIKQENVILAYWSTDPVDAESETAARYCNGFLADRKVTYSIDAIEINDRAASESFETKVEEYSDESVSRELEDLAIQAGIFSRFNIDPQMPAGRFIDLYKLWIQKSVQRELADKVLVVRNAGIIVGMVTVGEKNGRGDIGLLAVDSSMRGKKLGIALVNAAQQWTIENGFTTAQVVTQGENVSACRFYEKCGYRIDKIENVYHFWSQT